MSFNPGLSSKNFNPNVGKNQLGQHVQSNIQNPNYNQQNVQSNVQQYVDNNQKNIQYDNQQQQSNYNNQQQQQNYYNQEKKSQLIYDQQKNIQSSLNSGNSNVMFKQQQQQNIQYKIYPKNNYNPQQTEEELFRMFKEQRRMEEKKKFMQEVSRETSDVNRQREAYERFQNQEKTDRMAKEIRKSGNKGFIGGTKHKTNTMFNQTDGTFTRCEDLTFQGSMSEFQKNPRKCEFTPDNDAVRKDFVMSCQNNKQKLGLGNFSLKQMINKLQMIIRGGTLLKTRSDMPVDCCVKSNAFGNTWKVNGESCAFPLYKSGGLFENWGTPINEHVEKIWEETGMDNKIKIFGKMTQESLREGIGSPTQCNQEGNNGKYMAYMVNKDSKFMKHVIACKDKFKLGFGDKLKADEKGLYTIDTNAYERVCSQLLGWRDQLGLVDNYSCTIKRPNCAWNNQDELCRILGSCSGSTRNRCVNQFYNKQGKAMVVMKLKCQLVKLE